MSPEPNASEQVEAKLHLALRSFANHRFDEAERLCTEVLQVIPSHALAREALWEIYQQRSLFFRCHHYLRVFLFFYGQVLWPLIIFVIGPAMILFNYLDFDSFSVDDKLYWGSLLLLVIAILFLLWYVARVFVGVGYLLLLMDSRRQMVLSKMERSQAWFTFILLTLPFFAFFLVWLLRS